MAKRKKAQPWDAVFDRVQVYRNPRDVYHRPATEDELNTAESQLGVSLPMSYRTFMMRFGSGSLMDLVSLYCPSVVQKRDLGLVAHTRASQQAWEKTKKKYFTLYPNGEFLCRSVYFASDFTGSVYVWDPLDVSSRKTSEYRVFRLDRHYEDNPIPVGASFQDFVVWTEQHARSIGSEDSEPKPPGITFSPLYIRGKKQPLQRDVKLWLAWNNNTARDLALSIRGRGQTDAFPILADALQEAGCTNADLLNSCRTGDPDIDGQWVLQVLLGKAK